MLSEVIFLEGNNIRRIKGEVIDEGDFIIVKTLKKIYKINKNFVIKIEKNIQEKSI